MRVHIASGREIALAASGNVTSSVHEGEVIRESDASTRYLGFGIVFLIISILCVVLYALVTGVFGTRPPQTFLEASGGRAELAVMESPGSGSAWAALAGTRWAAGDIAGAWDAIEQGKLKVSDHSLLFVQTRELEFLIYEGKDDEALKAAVEYVESEEEYRRKEAADYSARGIAVPFGMADYGETGRLYVLKAAAEGNLEKWEDAVASLSDALVLDDKAADVLTLRGWAKLRSGDVAGARADFEQALRFMPEYGSAKDGLAASESSGAP